MKDEEINNVVNAWQDLYGNLLQESNQDIAPYKYLQIFENKGAAMGCSNPHPHGQAWCLDVIPTEVKDELDNMSEYYKNIILIFLGDYVELELQEKKNCC